MVNEEEFLKYEDIRKSGVTNMFDIKTVVKLSENLLDKEKCLDIMKNYSKYSEQYL